jgi:2-oxoglutarate ferredoxin oxidoreductase subunit gamma
MAERTEICLSGSGGQGLILAGIILADAAIRDGRSVVQSQSYGPEARGGASRAEVIIGGDELDYPKISSPDILLAMSQEASDKYLKRVRKEGMAVLDSTYVGFPAVNGIKIYHVPISSTAITSLGREMMANMVALGALVKLTGIVGRDSIEEAVRARVPVGSLDLNLSALEMGRELALELLFPQQELTKR